MIVLSSEGSRCFIHGYPNNYYGITGALVYTDFDLVPVFPYNDPSNVSITKKDSAFVFNRNYHRLVVIIRKTTAYSFCNSEGFLKISTSDSLVKILSDKVLIRHQILK